MKSETNAIRQQIKAEVYEEGERVNVWPALKERYTSLHCEKLVISY